MKLRKLRNGMNLKGKRVLVRIDANVPVKNGKAVDGPHGRIARSAVDINWLSHRGARVIVLTHLGRPNGKRVSAYTLAPVAKRLGSLLGGKIKLSHAIVGKKALHAVEQMKDGEVLLLENVRFSKHEKEDSAEFAKQLAELADMYVNNAFSVSHRKHTSVSEITKHLPSYAGHLLAAEASVLARLDQNIKHPFVLAMGGMKVETKLPVIKRFGNEVESVLLGGALSNTFLAEAGVSIGRSVFDKDGFDLIKNIPASLRKKILLPTDVLVSRSMRKDAKTEVKSVNDIRASERIVDIGPETLKQYQEKIGAAKMVIWNGPFGYCEIPKFCAGTHGLAKAIADRTGQAVTIVGGGDTVPVLEKARIADKFTLLSTGGGAMLEFLANKPLPGLEALNVS